MCLIAPAAWQLSILNPQLALAQSPTLDTTFGPGANNKVYSLALQADGKILVGGNFTVLGGQPRNYLARLNANGTLDTSFNPGTSSEVRSLAVQGDGKIMVGGVFTTLGGQPRSRIGRLNADGTLDANFNPGANDYVNSLALQADGKILVGGNFYTLGGHTRPCVGRLNADGTLDATFNSSANYDVCTLALQADGKILVGGGLTTLGGQPRSRIGRLNADGTLDANFNPVAGGSYPLPYVYSLAVQADGKVLVGGSFTTLGGQPRNRIGRLNVDGTVDASFAAEASGYDQGYVNSLAVQADGKILVGGLFANLGGQPRNCIGRLNPDGTVDVSFNPGAEGITPWPPYTYSLAVQADGRILVGGEFSKLGGQSCDNIGRLNSTEPAVQTLSYDDSTITWLRGGTTPELWCTTFEYSTDGVFWTNLGEGHRVAGGWERTNAIVPSDASLRARGQAVGGYRNASGWFVPDYWGRPTFVGQLESRTNDSGSTSVFQGAAGGSPPLSYQWFKDGLPLLDGMNVAGATTAALTVSNVLGADAGVYHVVVTNAWGNRTSLVATLTVRDPAIVVQPASQNREPGQSATFSVTVAGTGPFHYQWWKDGAVVPEATNATLVLTNLQGGDAGWYSVVVSNHYASVTSGMTLLTVNRLTLDGGFNPGASDYVNSLAVQADGKILVGGGFTTLAGQQRKFIGRLNADGTLDASFDPAVSGTVLSLAVQANGKILVGGQFTTLGWQPRSYLGRLNADGTLDATFNPGPSYDVSSLIIQADGKILVGGSFSYLDGQPRNFIGRLNADDTLDASFNPWAGGAVHSLALQADGKILAGGLFTTLGGQSRDRIGRLNADGTLDASFNPGAGGSYPYSYVSSLAVQADGKILVGGNFTTLGGQPRNYIGRLHADGTLDASFNPGASSEVYSLALQADGKILVGGNFTMLGGQPRNYVGRLSPDGTLDASFNPEPSGAVLSLTLQADGKILVGGNFTMLGGQPRANIGRLDNTESATQRMSYDGSTITWLLGGASPELCYTTFDYTTDGAFWTSLGEGQRVVGGWQRTNVIVPPDASVRAWGYAAGGYRTASSWFAVSYSGKPVFLKQPESRTNDVGTTAVFEARAGGSTPLSYQWFRDGLPLVDGGNVAGSTTAALSVSNVMGADPGSFHIVVSNAWGSRTSVVATLTVRDPIIVVQPSSQNREPGQNVTLTVAASGTGPLRYQWRKDEAVVPHATNTTLVLNNLQGPNAGYYSVEVRNQYGTVASEKALLTVNLITLDASLNPGANSEVRSLAVQTDGKILIGGSFTTLGGQPRNYVGRLNGDGTLDTSFNPGANGAVSSLAVQPDGKLLVGGSFTTLGGQSRARLGRLNPDGTLDTSFNPGAGWDVASLAVQPDGKILVGGSFTTLGGQPRNGIGRLNADGTLDTGFNPGASSSVNSFALQVDGRILVGGRFTALGGQPRNYIGRLNADGTLDTSFDPTAGGEVSSMAMQADGKIVVGGSFTSLGGQPCNRVGRLNWDGTPDTSFNPGASAVVNSLALQADGKILVGGGFTMLGGQPRYYFGRLNADGTIDATFNPGAAGFVNSLALQADGRILAGGPFSMLGTQLRRCIGRLNNTESATQTLSYQGSTINWLRGGTSPEVWRTVFEHSTNGVLWINLGEGSHAQDGWTLGGLTLPSAGQVRARGFVTGGRFNASAWFTESLLNLEPPPSPEPAFSVDSITGSLIRFKLTGGTNKPYAVETATNLPPPGFWEPVTTLTLTNGWGTFDWINVGEPTRFFRALGQ